MKPSERKGHKGEDWAKFLKEIADPQIQQILGDDPVKHFSRAMARENGEHSAEDLRARIEAKRKELEEFRLYTLGKWFHEKMGEHFPDGLLDWTVKHGPAKANELGWLWGAEHKPMWAAQEAAMPRMFPSSKVFLSKQQVRRRFGFFGRYVPCSEPRIIAQQVFHWSESEDK